MRRFSNIPAVGVIRSRLLVNALVDPDEAQRRLPHGLRPHVTEHGTVIGACLLDLADVRPRYTSAFPGVHLQAAAHRISVEWEANETIHVGVYVPARLTKSRTARVLGGRCFPGVHRRAATSLENDGSRIHWTVRPSSPEDFGVPVTARVVGEAIAVDAVGTGVCLAATVGLSPDHHGQLEEASMAPAHRNAAPVDIEEIDSDFIKGFTTATLAPSYLMRNVAVTWR